MHIHKVAILSVILPVTVLVAAACSASQEGLNEEERQYAEEVKAAEALSTSKFENFSEVFGQTWPVRARLIGALQEAGVGTAFTERLAAMEQLTRRNDFRAPTRASWTAQESWPALMLKPPRQSKIETWLRLC